MDAVERYVRVLRLFLPKDQREDIIRELTGDIRGRIEMQEKTLGRPLQAQEIEAIVGQYGHPLVTAARYGRQRYLVGPTVFPYYWLVLKVCLGLAVAGPLLGAVVLHVGGAETMSLQTLGLELFENILKTVGWITALAALAELWIARSTRVEQPARVTERPWAVSILRRASGTRVKRDPSVAGFIVLALVSAWWLLALQNPSLLFGPAAAHVTWGAAMIRLMPVLVVAQLVMVGERLVRLAWPDRARTVLALRTASRGLDLLFIVVVLTSTHEWVIWRETGAAGASDAFANGRMLPGLVNGAMSAAFVTAALVSIAQAAFDLIGWIHSRRASAAA